ncbi:MAG: hypothetical protein ACLFV3_12175 [Phycisphaeraceae bacterium]
MSRYASGTNVSVERSQQEVKELLRRYGASKFGLMEDDDQAAVMFVASGLTVRIVVPLPSIEDEEIALTDAGRERSPSATRTAYEKEVRRRWRALILAIKAKLEAVESGISTIEQEFMPFVVMPDGRSFADHALPQIRRAVESGQMPMLGLPEPKGADHA